MIKQEYICICDVCGAIENAVENGTQWDTYYTCPKSWRTGINSDFHICPECAKKLNMEAQS